VPTGVPTAVPTAAPTAGPTGVPGSIQLHYQCGMTNTTSMEMAPWYKIVNGGSTALNWTGIEIRYYFVRDSAGATFRAGNLVYPNNLQNNLNITFVNVSGDNFYAKITFSGTSEVIAAGATTGECRQTIYEDNAPNPNQANDFSADTTKTTYSPWTKMVVLNNGVVVCGTAPY
jgi:mannan endo-1,4-beta-mannosidase